MAEKTTFKQFQMKKIRRNLERQNTWRRDLEADITQTGLSWKQLERITQDRTGDVGETLCMAYAAGVAKGLSK